MAKQWIRDKELLLVPVLTIGMMVVSSVLTVIDFSRSIHPLLIDLIYAAQVVGLIFLATQSSAAPQQVESNPS